MPYRNPRASSFALLSVAAFCALPLTAFAQITPTAPVVPAPTTAPTPLAKPILPDAEKEKDIRQLITLTSGDKMGEQVLDQMIPEMQKMIPQVPPTFWQEFRKKTKMSELIDRLLPIYDKYYSKEDVKGLIQFYQTPLGQKIISVIPAISRESNMVGSAWGQEKAQEVISELQAKEAAGPKPAPAKPKPAKTPAARPKRAASGSQR